MKIAKKTPAQTRFEADVISHIETLRRFALKRTGNAVMADDLVQDTVLLALKNRARFKAGTNIRAWLFTILKNVHLNDIRKSKGNCEYLDEVHTDTTASVPAQESYMELQDIARSLIKLTPSQRETLMVHTFKSSSYEETAGRCNCTLGTVKSRISRARARLADQMQTVSAGTGYDDGALAA